MAKPQKCLLASLNFFYKANSFLYLKFLFKLIWRSDIINDLYFRIIYLFNMYMYLYFDNFLLSEWFLVWCFVCESWNIRMLTCFYSSEAANLCNQDYIQIVTVWFIYPFYCRCNLSELTSAFYNICSNSLKVFMFFYQKFESHLWL